METAGPELRLSEHPSLKPSLEGWKLARPTLSPGLYLPLKPSLEGWKLLFIKGPLNVPYALETFLRGMETSGGRSGSWTAWALKPSLEGWKPLDLRRPEPRGLGLETFLRGMETQGAGAVRQAAQAALKPSLEGWKLPPVPEELAGQEPLKPSLEGWKLYNLLPVGKFFDP